MSMYIRVKRQKQTVFLYTDPSEKVAELKKKLSEINSVSANRIRLIFGDAPLDDDKTVGDAKIDNDKVVFMVYKKEGSEDWEPVDVHKPEAPKSDKPE